MDREITDYWFVWMKGTDWPEQFGAEKPARERAEMLARANAGRSVYVGNFSPKERLLLPAELDVMKIS